MDKTIWQESDSDRLIHQLYQTMRLFSKSLRKMGKYGLITRVAHPNTRGKFIELTEKGAQAHRDLSSAVAEHRRKALQGLSPEMLQGLNYVMLRIQRNVSSGE